MTRKIFNILFFFLCTFIFASCSLEDDIDEIFYGKTWYMNGATINGMKLNADIKNFYTEAGTNAYYIAFSPGTFQGVLSSGVTFSGTWTADGKKHRITLKVTNNTEIDKTFDKQIFNIISSITSYESGAEYLLLKEDNDNKVFFGITR